MKKTSGWMRILALAMLCVMGLTMFPGCEEENISSDALTVAISEPFDNNFNYFDAENESTRMVISLVAGTLVRENENGGYEPFLGDITAETADGQLVVTLTLKKGIRFSNGKEATIDDLISMYKILADPGYTGVYSDFWKFPIEGLAAYYWDDPTGTGEAPDFEAEAKEKYAPGVISPEDLAAYLYETKLEGEWTGSLDSYRDEGITWRQFLIDLGYEDQLKEIETNESKIVTLLSEIYVENDADRYDASEWYARKNKREYMKATTADGIDVPEISGIVKTDDYHCRVTFTDPSADYISILNRPLLSSANFPLRRKGGGDEATAAYVRTPLLGAGPYAFDGYEDKILTLVKNRHFTLEQGVYSTVRLRYAEGELLPVNCFLRQLSCGFYLANRENAENEEILAKMEKDAEKYGLTFYRLRGGALVFNPADADFTPLYTEDGGSAGYNYFFGALYRIRTGG